MYHLRPHSHSFRDSHVVRHLSAMTFCFVVGCTSSGGAPSGTGGSAATGSGGSSTATGGNSASGGSTAATGGRSGTGGTSNGSGGSSSGGSGPGSGGSAGSGGSGGSGGGASGGASGSGGAASATGGGSGVAPFLKEDFESGTVGKQPAGWDTFIGYVKNGGNPQGEYLALVDSTHVHGGKNALHIHGGGTPAMITRPLPSGTNKLYVRAYFYMSRQLGMTTTGSPNHETLLGIRKLSGGANDEVRFGEIKGVIGTNEVPTDNISPKMAQWGMGPVVAANKWACIEVAFLADEPQHVLQAWADGTLIHSITAGDQWQNGTMPMDWMKGKFVEVILGWHSFSNMANDIWIDDLALSTAPIGCN